jgi:hypothetical protein
MDGLQPELITQMKGLGFESESYPGDRPTNARFT